MNTTQGGDLRVPSLCHVIRWKGNVMGQQKIGLIEMRLLLGADYGNYTPSLKHTMDEIARVIGRVNNVQVIFAFYDEDSGRRLRQYGPFGPASAEMTRLAEVELGETLDEDVSA